MQKAPVNGAFAIWARRSIAGVLRRLTIELEPVVLMGKIPNRRKSSRGSLGKAFLWKNLWIAGR
jgi:hypothetical protein